MATMTSNFVDGAGLDAAVAAVDTDLSAEVALSVATAAFDRAELLRFSATTTGTPTLLAGSYANGDSATFTGSNLLLTTPYPDPSSVAASIQRLDYRFAGGQTSVALTGDWTRDFSDWPFIGPVDRAEIVSGGERITFVGVRPPYIPQYVQYVGGWGFDNRPVVGEGVLSAIRFDKGGASLVLNGSFDADTASVNGSLQSIIHGTVRQLTLTQGGSTLSLSGLSLDYAAVEGASATDLLALALAGNDVINGSAASQALQGFAGNDTLQGQGGNDTLVGGTGDDTYTVDATGDTVVELAGEGTDRVLVKFNESGAYTLAAHVEHASVATVAPGVIAALTGNALANSLVGGAGQDILDGGAGADTLVGGAGNDSYVVDDGGDVVTELAGGGVDAVHTALAAFSLASIANVEGLVFTGSGDFAGTGNGADNGLVGGAGADTLAGGGGHDTLAGGDGADSLAGEAGSDLLRGGAGNGRLDGGEGNDLLEAGAGDDVLDGGRGADVLLGGAGDDALLGGAGRDTLVGGAGNDTLTGGGGADRFVFNSLSGTDDITDFVSGTDKIAINRSVFGAVAGAAGAAPVHLAGLGPAFAYDATTGELTYDADGVGGAAASVVAHIGAGLGLADDFLIIG